MADANAQLGLGELASQYGYAAAFFDSDPELKALINQAVSGQWTPDRFKAALTASNWYRSKTDAVKQWQELSGRDPAEAANRVRTKQADLAAKASQMGLNISSGRLNQLARDSLSMGWSDQMLSNALASEFHYVPGKTSGGAATDETTIRATAGDYGVTLSDGQVGDLVGGLLSGKYTNDHVNDLARDMARSKYPGMKGYLDQGFTVRQVASPYVQSYSQILEKDASSVDLNDPLMQRALQGTPDPKTGVAAMQGVYQFEQSLRQDPRWLQTNNAHQSMETTALQIARDFGIHKGG